MSWVNQVRCSNPACSITAWRVLTGAWTCQCGKPMTTAEISAYHEELRWGDEPVKR